MFKYLMFQTFHFTSKNRKQFSHIHAGYKPVIWWIPDLHEVQESTVIAPQLFIGVSDGGLWCQLSPAGLLSSECVARSGSFLWLWDSPSPSWGLGADNICSAFTRLFLLLLMFWNCELAPRLPGCHPGRQVPGLRATDISQRFWIRDWDDWNAILSYLNTTAASLLSALSPCRAAGEVCNILSESAFNRKIFKQTLYLFVM